MKKLLIVYNKNSGMESYDEIARNIGRELWAWEKDYYVCESIEDTINFRNGLNESEYHCCIILGGDGTINSMLKRKGHSNLPLICLPTGTANDISSALGMTLNMSNLAYLVSNIEKNTIGIDILTANGIPFITTGGVGITSFVLAEYNHQRSLFASFNKVHKYFGKDIYKLLTIKNSFYKSRIKKKYRISWGEYSEVVDSSCVLITNQPKLGNDLMVAPAAKLDDGLFNVMITTKTTQNLVISDLLSMSKKNLPKDCIQFETDELKVETIDGTKINFFADGEIIGNSNKVDFGIRQKAQPMTLNRILEG